MAIFARLPLSDGLGTSLKKSRKRGGRTPASSNFPDNRKDSLSSCALDEGPTLMAPSLPSGWPLEPCQSQRKAADAQSRSQGKAQVSNTPRLPAPAARGLNAARCQFRRDLSSQSTAQLGQNPPQLVTQLRKSNELICYTAVQRRCPSSLVRHGSGGSSHDRRRKLDPPSVHASG
jgi:hypothetical protein